MAVVETLQNDMSSTIGVISNISENCRHYIAEIEQGNDLSSVCSFLDQRGYVVKNITKNESDFVVSFKER